MLLLWMLPGPSLYVHRTTGQQIKGWVAGGKGIATLLRKPADWEEGSLVSQRTIFPKLEYRLLLY